MNVHNNPELVLDTLDSISTFMTSDILVVIDGTSHHFDNIKLPVHTLKGFNHNHKRSPYRNIALGLKNLFTLFPDKTWYAYMEADCLVTSERFRYNLEMAEKQKIWMLGNDGRVELDLNLSFLESLLGDSLKKHSYYLLGCCQFFHRDFLQKIHDFFDTLLNATAGFNPGEIPWYNGYDISEHLYPTLARYFGGNIGVFATYAVDQWHGSHKVFPIRFRPEIEEIYPETSIIHPIKNHISPIRIQQRLIRNEIKNNRICT